MAQITKSDSIALEIMKALGMEDKPVRKIVLELETDNVARVYVEMFGSEQLLRVDWPEILSGVHVTELGGANHSEASVEVATCS